MRPSEGFISLWPIMVIAVIVVLSAFSITPTAKLQAQAPADFMAVPLSGGKPNMGAAAQYWKVATAVTQWKYNRAAKLPAQVPGDFVLAQDASKTLGAQEQAVRAAYWAKLREEWLRPNNWHTTYTLDFHWALHGVQGFSNEALRFFHQS